eukprot:TRINITY_DN2908_c0_g1_i1.p1 TRINITY_DN2908_c0_g1~~TRINITY_DN2908_c0_g1_i1.p1  ORF type:complete len:208 (-),score=26.18 TRINITY_DN2908_c0_g1_i1:151-774(-)
MLRSDSQEDPVCKLSLIGDAMVGKTSLLTRYTGNTFSETTANTVGVDYKEERLIVNGKAMTLQVWDTAGQERFRTMTSTYYRGAHGILIVFSLTDRNSFDSIKSKWLEQIDRYALSTVIKVLLGNKCDVPPSERAVSTEEAQALAREMNIAYFEVSARTGNDVLSAFRHVPTLVAVSVFGSAQPGSGLVRVRSERKMSQSQSKGCKC